MVGFLIGSCGSWVDHGMLLVCIHDYKAGIIQQPK